MTHGMVQKFQNCIYVILTVDILLLFLIFMGLKLYFTMIYYLDFCVQTNFNLVKVILFSSYLKTNVYQVSVLIYFSILPFEHMFQLLDQVSILSTSFCYSKWEHHHQILI